MSDPLRNKVIRLASELAVGDPTRRSLLAALKQAARPLRKVETAKGLVTLTQKGDQYVMQGPTGEHTLSVAQTDQKRLDAHWRGFIENNGGELVYHRMRWSPAQYRIVDEALSLMARGDPNRMSAKEAQHALAWLSDNRRDMEERITESSETSGQQAFAIRQFQKSYNIVVRRLRAIA